MRNFAVTFLSLVSLALTDQASASSDAKKSFVNVKLSDKSVKGS